LIKLRRLLGRLAFVVLAGIAVGWAAFSLTSGGIPPTSLGAAAYVPCEVWPQGDAPGFDPWTGQPHFPRLICAKSGAPLEYPVPAEMVGRWAIPVPVGFLIGAAAAAGVLLLIDRRRRPPDRTMAELGAVGGV